MPLADSETTIELGNVSSLTTAANSGSVVGPVAMAGWEIPCVGMLGAGAVGASPETVTNTTVRPDLPPPSIASSTTCARFLHVYLQSHLILLSGCKCTSRVQHTARTIITKVSIGIIRHGRYQICQSTKRAAIGIDCAHLHTPSMY
jgi:hypothetical protein